MLIAEVLLLATVSEEQLPVSVSSTAHFYSIDCDPHLDGSCYSPPLEQIANDLVTNSTQSVYISINVSQLQLNANARFSHIEAFTIRGDPFLNTTVTCTAPNTGLVLNDIANLTFSDITVTRCGALINTSQKTNYSSAITIVHGRDVKVSNVVIMKSVGIGLTILDHHGGNVHIKSSQFLENALPHDCPTYRNIRGGGGVYVGGFEQNPSDPITFKFDNCTCEENVAHTMYYDHLYNDDFGQSVSGHGLGGGVALHLRMGLTDIHIVFSRCIFRKNEAFLGGGLAVKIEETPDSDTRNVSVKVENSLFEKNGCNSSVSGGGMYISLFNKFHSYQALVHGNNFTNNYARFGGGIYLYLYHERSADHSSTVEIEDCTFEFNSAHIGSAIDIASQRFLKGFLVIPIFRNCKFSNNMVKPLYTVNKLNHTQRTYGIATLYVSLYSIKLEGYNRFENNLGTAIHIVSGNINMSQSNVNFFNNSGIKGGAVSLIGASSMIVGPNRTYKFVNNTALDRGGALYAQVIDNHDIYTSGTCFIQYYDSIHIPARDWPWSATITFTGNRAFAGMGHTIFATTLYPCQISGHDTENNITEVFTIRGITLEESPPIEGVQVATEGALLCSEMIPIEVIPGEHFTLGVTIVDDLGQTAKEALSTSILKPSHAFPDMSFSTYVENMMLDGKPGEAIELYLQTTTSRSSYTRLNVTFIDCPPGFSYNASSSQCNCSHQEYAGLVKCDAFNSYITPGYWAGFIENSTEMVTSYCPQSYCNYKERSLIRLPKKNDLLNRFMCGKSRTGIACGSCTPGYTAHFHSPSFQCKHVDPTLCKVGWLFYILSELLPVTVVFITVLVLNISFTSGTVNGFILFCQMLYSFDINASGLIAFPSAISTLIEGYRLIYGVFSLDFFPVEALSFCLWPNASALDMQAFKYVTIVYALLLVMVFIWFMDKCGTRCWKITTVKSSVVHGISAFLILCYSQSVHVSLRLLNSFPLHVRKGNNLTVPRRVWLNGNIVSFSGGHLPYALPALFCLLTIGIFPPILLVAYPLFNRLLAICGCEESKLVTFVSQKVPVSSLMPLFDSFQGCFKDNLRFFAGLYFFYRWTVLIIGILPSVGYSRAYAVKGALIIVMLALHALCQPYALRKHNIIDALLIVSLALTNAITFFHYHIFQASAENHSLAGTEYITTTASIQLVLIYLPFLCMMVYVLVLLCRLKCRQYNDQSKSTRTLLSNLKGHINKGNSLDEEELPHRLIADYEQF